MSQKYRTHSANNIL